MTTPLHNSLTRHPAEGSTPQSSTGPKAALEKWLAESPEVAAFCTEIRAIRSDYAAPSTIDQLNTSAKQSLEFAKAASLFEKTVNFFSD